MKSQAMSPEGRRRFVLSGAKTAGLALLLVALAVAAYAIASSWSAEPKMIAAATNMAPLQERNLVLVTDGVLDKAWLVRSLALPRAATLMELDLYQLQARLAASGQVKRVVVSKSFPATLVATIAERTPVARLRAETGSDYLVARDGVVYAGTGYDPEMIRALPWLDGVQLVRAGTGFAPLPHMDVVADLLAKGRLEAPQLYRTWQVVNLDRLERDAEIEVRSSEIPRIIFSTDMDFFTQLTRLDYARDQPGPPMKTINVGLGPQVVVTYDPAAGPVLRPPPVLVKPATPVQPAFPNLQRTPQSNRDL